MNVYVYLFISSEVEHRFYTTMQKFALKYSLGRAICGNFFRAEWDESVDQTFEGLKQPLPAYICRDIAGANLPMRTQNRTFYYSDD